MGDYNKELDKYVKIRDIMDAMSKLVNDGVWLGYDTSLNIVKAIASVPRVEMPKALEMIGYNSYIKYEDLCDSSWPYCAECGHCDNCRYAEDDNKCGIYEWIKGLPKYQIGMEKV